MKLFSLIAFTLIFTGSAFSQNKSQNRVEKGKFKMTAAPTVVTSPRSEETNSERPAVISGVIGVVQVSTQCGTYIEVSENDVKKKFYITNLAEEFQVHGKTIVFDYVVDTVRIPSGCDFTNAIKLNNVKAD